MGASAAMRFADELANGATRAIGRIKGVRNEEQRHVCSQHLELERSLFVVALHGDEAGEGLADILQERKASFQP